MNWAKKGQFHFLFFKVDSQNPKFYLEYLHYVHGSTDQYHYVHSSTEQYQYIHSRSKQYHYIESMTAQYHYLGSRSTVTY